jgi:hypothetical protein
MKVYYLLEIKLLFSEILLHALFLEHYHSCYVVYSSQAGV